MEQLGIKSQLARLGVGKLPGVGKSIGRKACCSECSSQLHFRSTCPHLSVGTQKSTSPRELEKEVLSNFTYTFKESCFKVVFIRYDVIII
jgi:hypothetical protein